VPERGFATEAWTQDGWFQELSRDQRYLFIYLWSNNHVNQAGLYTITLATMSFEAAFTNDELRGLIPSLSPKVEWYPEANLIWVRNFLKRQSKSSRFTMAAVQCIDKNSIPDDLKDEFYSYNESLFQNANIEAQVSLSKHECVIIRDRFICQYCGKDINTIFDYEVDHIIPKIKGGKDHYVNLATSCATCNKHKGGRTPEEANMQTPNAGTFHAAQAVFLLKNDDDLRQKFLNVFPNKARKVESILKQHCTTLNNVEAIYSPNATANADLISNTGKGVRVTKGKGELSSEEKEIIKSLEKLKGWQADEDDVLWLQGLRSEFPGFTLAEFKACIDYYSGRSTAKHKGIWKNRFRNWMIKKQEFDKYKGGRQRPGRVASEKELDAQEIERGLR